MKTPSSFNRLFRIAILRRVAIALIALAWSSLAVCGEIHDAAKNGDLEKVKAMLEKKPKLVFSKDAEGGMPLHWAAFNGHKEVVELLLANKADVNGKAANGLTPLHVAAGKGYKDVAELLLANKADANARNNTGVTPLHIAAQFGNKDVAELLLANMAKVNAKDNDGTTPLHVAVDKGSKDLVELLLANKADVNANNSKYGLRPLHVAAGKGYKDVAELLLANKADVNAKNNNGATSLHLAADKGYKDVVKLLLASKADVNAKANNGVTPLHAAVENGYKDVVELLLANNADLNATANNGKTALDLAVANGRRDVAELLRQHSGQEQVAISLENSNKLAKLTGYVVGKTTRQTFLDDKWNAEDPFRKVIGIVGFKVDTGVSYYLLGYYPSAIFSDDQTKMTIRMIENVMAMVSLAGDKGEFAPFRRFGNTTQSSWNSNAPMAAVEICTINFTNEKR